MTVAPAHFVESDSRSHAMKLIRAFRNLDRHGQQRAPEVIEEELRQLEPHLARFREDLVRLEVVASQTRGKKRIKVSLRLQLPSGVIAIDQLCGPQLCGSHPHDSTRPSNITIGDAVTARSSTRSRIALSATAAATAAPTMGSARKFVPLTASVG